MRFEKRNFEDWFILLIFTKRHDISLRWRKNRDWRKNPNPYWSVNKHPANSVWMVCVTGVKIMRFEIWNARYLRSKHG